MKKQTICLNMIVKDEAHVIRRCLASVKPLIDTWIIVDTGSKDGTQEIIREFMKDIPGELFERPWVDFGHNRNEALALARRKADYILFIDADDRLVIEDNFVLPNLKKDYYAVRQRIAKEHAIVDHPIILLIKDIPDFSWKGVLHEELTWSSSKTCDLLSGIIN